MTKIITAATIAALVLSATATAQAKSWSAAPTDTLARSSWG